MSFLAAIRPNRNAMVLAHRSAMNIDNIKTRRKRMNGLGAVPFQPRQGTRAWWIWYATTYLPQQYRNATQAQLLTLLARNPLYSQFGNPYQFQQPQTSYYPYGSANYTWGQYNYPYYGYQNQFTPTPVQAQYQQYIPYGEIDPGVIACNQQNGIYDATTQTCSAGSGSAPYGNTVIGIADQLPNVVGKPKWVAVAALNGAGYRVWLSNEDGVSGGVPPDYDPRRVDITVQGGVVTGASVG